MGQYNDPKIQGNSNTSDQNRRDEGQKHRQPMPNLDLRTSRIRCRFKQRLFLFMGGELGLNALYQGL
jgi:hypothetical protein